MSTVEPKSNLPAIELLRLGNRDREIPFLNKIWPQFLGVVFGIGTGAFLNAMSRRPVFSGIQKHVLGVVVWTAGLTYLNNKRDEYFAERDAVLRHYIELHAEDFPIPERKKIGDIFEPWHPVR